jgi:hypothetical protein
MWLNERSLYPVTSGPRRVGEHGRVLPHAMESLAHSMRCARGQTIRAHAAPAKHLCRLTSGMAGKY